MKFIKEKFLRKVRKRAFFLVLHESLIFLASLFSLFDELEVNMIAFMLSSLLTKNCVVFSVIKLDWFVVALEVEFPSTLQMFAY